MMSESKSKRIVNKFLGTFEAIYQQNKILLQIFMGAKIYSQGAEIFAASCKNHFLQPR